jgi:hypothetical protein
VWRGFVTKGYRLVTLLPLSPGRDFNSRPESLATLVGREGVWFRRSLRTLWFTLWSARPTVPHLRLAVSAATDHAVGLLMVRTALFRTLSRSDFGAGLPAGPRHGTVA